MIGEQYESEDEFDGILPIVEGRYDSDSESESDSEDEESVVETHLLHKNILKKATTYYKEHRSYKVTVQFSLEDEKGNKETYLGLLDAGSTGSLISEELVKLFKLETKNSKSTWNTNTGEFKTRKTAVTKNLRISQFTNKRTVNGSKFYVNKNV